MKKGLMHVFAANSIFLLINLITNLLLPKYMTIDTYSQFKTYALYLSYSGLFHFGYNDGMYLKYGGREIRDISHEDFGKNFFNYAVLELVVAGIFALIGMLNKNLIIIAFSLGMFSINIIGYFRSFYQSIGEFKLYGKALNYEKVFLLIIYLFLIFVVHTDRYILFIGCQIAVEIVICIFLIIYLNRRFYFIEECKFSLEEIKENIRLGFILMLGNFANGFFTAIDRWFVKILMTSVDFAIFSFAVSMENMLNVFVTPISITLYNNFAKHKDIQHIMKIKSNVLLWGFVVIGAAFPCKWILVNYLKNYSEASDIIFALFATQLFYAVVKGIYVNVYKVMGKQKKYFNQVMLMTAISIILNIILYSVFKSKLAIAFGTLIASIIWFIICEITNKEYRFKKNEILTMFLVLALYLFAGLFMKTNFGCIVYITGTISLSFYLMRDSVMDILVVLKSRGK